MGAEGLSALINLVVCQRQPGRTLRRTETEGNAPADTLPYPPPTPSAFLSHPRFHLHPPHTRPSLKLPSPSFWWRPSVVLWRCGALRSDFTSSLPHPTVSDAVAGSRTSLGGKWREEAVQTGCVKYGIITRSANHMGLTQFMGMVATYLE